MINQKHTTLKIALIALVALFTASCMDSLNTEPLDDDVVTSASLYETQQDYKRVLAKLYAGFANTGQQGPAGNGDIAGIDEGFSSYIRQYWIAQELSTDEAVVGWSDAGLPDFNYQAWTASNDFVLGMYSRIFYEITLANEFISHAKNNDNPVIQGYNAEARFLRALSYWHALDLFGGGIPFVTEEDGVGAYYPKPVGADSLFHYIESELKAIERQLTAPQQNAYPRADRAAAWSLLTKLYLNAEVYIGEAHYTEAITYANKVIAQGGYTLEPEYDDLFRADNHTAKGIIFAIAFDGINNPSYGGTTFLTCAQIGGNMVPVNFGVNCAWAGHRVTPKFVAKFNKPDEFMGTKTDNPGNAPTIYVPGGYQAASGYTSDWSPGDAPPLVSPNSDSVYVGYVYMAAAGSQFKFTADQTWDTNWGDNGGDGTLEVNGANIVAPTPGLYKITVNLNDMTYAFDQADSRNMLYTNGQTLEIENLADFTNGYALTKWKNITSTGQPGSDLAFVDIDFPMFRLADVYLMYAEAVLRGGQGGSMATALQLVNDIRERAYGSSVGNITQSELTLDFILNERARELYWEGHRRTDLIRFGKFTGDNYLWSWKGHEQAGAPTDDHYALYPIPVSDINANPNLEQNPGY